MNIEKSHFRNLALTSSLIFATLGLILAVIILALFNVFGLVFEFLDSALTAIFVLYLSAACFGIIAGNLIYKIGTRGIGIWLIGVGLAWICLITAALAGSSVQFFSNYHNSGAFGDYIIKPLFWVMFFGIVPALLLGLVYVVIVKRFLREKLT